MGNRRTLWIVAAVLGAAAVFWGIGQAVGPSGGDVDLNKALDAMQQVKTFRGTYTQTASGSAHSEKLWEVDCNRVIVHQQSHDTQSSTDSPSEMKEDELLVGKQRYTRDSNGSWESIPSESELYSAKWYCDNVAQGTARDLLPDVRTMVHHAMTEKGSKKTINGVRCQEWKFATRTAVTAQGGSICIGIDDHLPYEVITDGGRYSYADYNRPIQIDVPEAVLQPASSINDSN